MRNMENKPAPGWTHTRMQNRTQNRAATILARIATAALGACGAVMTTLSTAAPARQPAACKPIPEGDQHGFTRA